MHLESALIGISMPHIPLIWTASSELEATIAPSSPINLSLGIWSIWVK